MKTAIRKSRQELIELGIKTTYAVAVRKDGRFCIIDAIVAEVAGTGERTANHD